jgi:hypothetical protein
MHSCPASCPGGGLANKPTPPIMRLFGLASTKQAFAGVARGQIPLPCWEFLKWSGECMWTEKPVVLVEGVKGCVARPGFLGVPDFVDGQSFCG